MKANIIISIDYICQLEDESKIPLEQIKSMVNESILNKRVLIDIDQYGNKIKLLLTNSSIANIRIDDRKKERT